MADTLCLYLALLSVPSPPGPDLYRFPEYEQCRLAYDISEAYAEWATHQALCPVYHCHNWQYAAERREDAQRRKDCWEILLNSHKMARKQYSLWTPEGYATMKDMMDSLHQYLGDEMFYQGAMPTPIPVPGGY